MKVDRAELQSVRDFVAEFKSKHSTLNGLVCNAGMVSMSDKVKYTKHDLELTMVLSYFGHFLMTEMLLDTLKAIPGSRMVIFSSVVHSGSPNSRPDVHLDDLNYKKRKYNNFEAYIEAKVASVLYSKKLVKRLEGSGVSAFSLHPGWARPNFGSGGGAMMKILFL